MKFIIDTTDFSTYVSSGRISNIFKSLNLKDVKFEEAQLLSLQKPANDYLTYEQIIDFGKNKTQEFLTKRKYDNKKYLTALVGKSLSSYINNLDIQPQVYFDNFLQDKTQVLQNSKVQEKILKLQKLKAINV